MVKIHGFNKLTLLDYPGRLAATVFLNGCNFRCPFCHNAGLVLPQQLRTNFTVQDILDFLDTRRGKLDGVLRRQRARIADQLAETGSTRMRDKSTSDANRADRLHMATQVIDTYQMQALDSLLPGSETDAKKVS